MHYLVAILIGAVSGWLAGLIMGSKGGLIRNIILGIAGGFVGSFIFRLLPISVADGYLGTIITSVVGAALIIFIVNRFIK